MSANLRSRLARIKSQRVKRENPPPRPFPPDLPPARPSPRPASALFADWDCPAEFVLHRGITLSPAAPPLSASLSAPLSFLLPDLRCAAPEALGRENFLFFDLETTGLSGGAGTVAFLAAFGFFTAKNTLRVDQFLLLDYPGEADFLEAVLAYLKEKDSPFLGTYNGKSFDTPLVKTRFLMHGLRFPEFPQLDLLHPSRRLWKRILPNCSQSTIETMILGLKRDDDISGAQAPDIWFDFLRAGGETDSQTRTAASEALLAVCDHNVKDIFGLSRLFNAFAEIAASPLDAAQKYRCDEENLALLWRRGLKTAALPLSAKYAGTSRALLERAALSYAPSALRLGLDLQREADYSRARKMFAAALRLADGDTAPDERERRAACRTKALALLALAIDSERRLDDAQAAARCCREALELPGMAGGLRERLQKRLSRLEKVR